jgi:hypothetical protein
MEGMYRLIDIAGNQELGIITEEQVQFLIDNLEEEGIEAQDYFVDHDTLDFLEESSCDEELLQMLTEALEWRESIDIRYEVSKRESGVYTRSFDGA